MPGGRPTVYIGSYDQRFYALDARNGAVRWSRKADGRISGGATVLGDLVFFSTLNGTTTAVGARTGQQVWKTQRGKFNPIVSNGRGLFLVGQTNLYGLDGRPPKQRARQGADAVAPGSSPSAKAAEVRRRATARRGPCRRRATRPGSGRSTAGWPGGAPPSASATGCGAAAGSSASARAARRSAAAPPRSSASRTTTA